MRLAIRSGPASGTSHELAETLVLGRDDGCDVVLDDEKASRRHARLSVGQDGTVTAEDLGSTNGTYVRGELISGPVTLRPGDSLTIGDTVLGLDGGEATVVAPSAPPSAPAERPSVVERRELRRSLRRSQVIALVAGAGVLIALAVVLLFVTGIFGGNEEQPSAAEIIEDVTPSTVQIRTVLPDGSTAGIGTGWVYDAEQGLIVTNSHVATAQPKLTVTLGEETAERPAQVVGVAQCDDLALLRVQDTSGMVTMPLGAQSDLEQGETVIALGYPGTLADGDPLITTEGVVSVVKTRTARSPEEQVYPNVIQTDAVINPGNSGGPLVDTDAKLVGVNTLKNPAAGFEGQFFAIAVDRVKEVVTQLAEGRSTGWPGLAFRFFPSAEEIEADGFPAQPGLLVLGAHDGTFAAKHGWNDGPFLLVAIDGKPVDGTWRSYCDAVGDYQEGETATFSVVAPGQTEPQSVNIRFE
jgi:S1-C subfamily serine protease